MNIGQWYNVQLCQKLIGTDKAQMSLTVDGTVVWEQETKPIQYENVIWYQCNPSSWNPRCIGDKIEVKDMTVNSNQAICTTDTTCSMIPDLGNIVGFVTCFLNTIIGG